MLEEVQPDVVMTDIKMPYMDGLKLCGHIKRKISGDQDIAVHWL